MKNQYDSDEYCRQILELHEHIDEDIKCGATPLMLQTLEEQLMLLYMYNDLFSPNNIAYRFHDENLYYEDFKTELDSLKDRSKEELSIALAKAHLHIKQLEFICNTKNKILKFLSKRVTYSHERRLMRDYSKQKKKVAKHGVDKLRMLECLNIVTNNDFTTAKPIDYLKFERVLRKKYPTMAYVKAPRLTPEEKALPPDLKEEAIKLKTSNEWKKSSLRKFFLAQTKVKPTTKFSS